MKPYPRKALASLESIRDVLAYMVRERDVDVKDFDNLQQRFMAGRKVGKIPTGANDVSSDDKPGDYNITADSVYFCVEDPPGTVKWGHACLSTTIPFAPCAGSAGPTVTLTGEATGSGAGTVPVTLTNNSVIGKVLSGFSSGTGTVTSSDSILTALQKVVGNIAALVTGVSSVFGRTGAVTAQSGDYNSGQITESGNLFFTDERAQDAVGSILTDSGRIDFTYNDPGNSITADLIAGSVSDTYLSAGINVNKIAAGSVDNTEFSYLDGVTSGIQGQLNGKQPSGNYITALTGEGTAAGPGSVAITLNNNAVTGKVLTGFVSGVGTVAASDSILQAIQKIVGNMLAYVFPQTKTAAANQWLNSYNATTGIFTSSQPTYSDLGGTPPTFNQNTTGSAAKWTTARLLAGNSVDGSANVPFANKFIVQGTADTGLSGAQFMGALATGIVKNTTSTGVQSIAVANTDYQSPITLTTTGNTGPSTFNGTTLNVPNYNVVTYNSNNVRNDQGPQSGSYGAITGLINGSNTVFTVSNGAYASGSLVVRLNGQVQTQGSAYDWVETSPGAGTFTFAVAPPSGSIIQASYVTVGAAGYSTTPTGVVFTATAQKQVQASAVAANVAQSALPTSGVGSLTIPANALIVGKVYRLRTWGSYQTPVAPGSVTVRILLGATVIASVVVAASILAGSSTYNELYGEAIITCRTTGTTGTITCNGYLTFEISAGTTTVPFSTVATNATGVLNDTVSINTTNALLIDVTEAWSSTTAGQGTVIGQTTFEVLN